MPAQIIRHFHPSGGFIDASHCTACGQCESLRPEQAAGAVEITLLTDVSALCKGSQMVFQDQKVLFERCGGPVATRRMLERIAVLLGDEYNAQLMASLCINCRGS